MRFSETRLKDFELETQLQPNLAKLRHKKPENFQELLELSSHFLYQIKYNLTTNDTYSRITIHYIVQHYDAFYQAFGVEIRDIVKKGTYQDLFPIIQKVTCMLKFEHSFSIELKGEKQAESLETLVDLLVYLYDTEALSILLLTLVEKTTYEEYDKGHINWIKKLFSFIQTLLSFFEKYDFPYLISESVSFEEMRNKALFQFYQTLERIHLQAPLAITEQMMKEMKQLNLNELKWVIIQNHQKWPSELLYRMLAELAIIQRLDEALKGHSGEITNIYFITGILFEVFWKLKSKVYSPSLEYKMIKWEDDTRLLMEAFDLGLINSKSFFLHLLAIDKRNFHRIPTARGQIFLLHKVNSREEWGLSILRKIMRNFERFNQEASLCSTEGNLIVDILRVFLNIEDIISSYYLKIEPRSTDDERFYKDTYAQPAQKFFIEFDLMLQRKEIFLLPKGLQENIYTNYFNIISSDFECCKMASLNGLYYLNEAYVYEAMTSNSTILSSPIEKLRTPFWWERYSSVYREKMDQMCETILNSRLFKELPHILSNPEHKAILIKKPEIFSAFMLVFIEVIKRRASIFNDEYANALRKALELIPMMENLTGKQAEDILSILINFSFEDQIDRHISVEHKINVYYHCLGFLAPHNWSNRTQIRFMFWGCSIDAAKAKMAVTLLKEVSRRYKAKMTLKLSSLMSTIPKNTYKSQQQLWAFEFGVFSFEILMGIYGCFLVFLRDVADPVMKQIAEEIQPLMNEIISMQNSPVLLFMPNDVCSRYQYYNFCDAFKSTEEKKSPIFKAFLHSFQELVNKLDQRKDINILNITDIVNNINLWKPEGVSIRFFSGNFFEKEDYDLLLFVHLLIRCRKMLAFWQSQLFKKEKETHLYETLARLTPKMVKVAFKFQTMVFNELSAHQFSDKFKESQFDWMKFFEMMWEGVIYVTRVFGMGSSDICKDLYVEYLKNAKQLIKLPNISLDVKMASISGFNFKSIAKSSELSKKLGIFGINEWFQGIFFENGGLTLYHTLLEDIDNRLKQSDKSALTPMQDEFLSELITFYTGFEPTPETNYQVELLRVMWRVPLERAKGKVQDVMERIHQACFKQLEYQHKKLKQLGTDLDETRERIKTYLDQGLKKTHEAEINNLIEVESRLTARIHRIEENLFTDIERFLEICGSDIFSLLPEVPDQEMFIFTGERLQGLARLHLDRQKEKYVDLVVNMMGKYRNNYNSDMAIEKEMSEPFANLNEFKVGFQKYYKVVHDILHLMGNYRDLKIWELTETNRNNLINNFSSFSVYWETDLLETSFNLLNSQLREILNSDIFVESWKNDLIVLSKGIFSNNATYLSYKILLENPNQEFTQFVYKQGLNYFTYIRQLQKKQKFEPHELKEQHDLLLDFCYLLNLIDPSLASEAIRSLEILSNLSGFLGTESESPLGFVLSCLKFGVSESLLVETKIRDIFKVDKAIVASNFEDEFIFFEPKLVAEVVRKSCEIIASGDNDKNAAFLTLKSEFPKFTSIHETIDQIHPICRNLVDSYLDTIVEVYFNSMARLQSSDPNKEKNLPKRDQKDLWDDLLYVLKEFDFIFPYCFLKKIKIPPISKQVCLIAQNTNWDFMNFAMRVMLRFDRGYFVKFFRVLLNDWKTTYGEVVEYENVPFSKLLLSKFMEISLQMLKEETEGSKQPLESIESIETITSLMLSIRFLVRRFEQSHENRLFWDFVRVVISDIFLIIHKYSKRNLHELRKILNLGLFGEFYNLIRTYNDKSGLKRSNMNQYYHQILRYVIATPQKEPEIAKDLAPYIRVFSDLQNSISATPLIENGTCNDSYLRMRKGMNIEIPKFNDGVDEETSKFAIQIEDNMRGLYNYLKEQPNVSTPYIKNMSEGLGGTRSPQKDLGLVAHLKKTHLVDQDEIHDRTNFMDELLNEARKDMISEDEETITQELQIVIKKKSPNLQPCSTKMQEEPALHQSITIIHEISQSKGSFSPEKLILESKEFDQDYRYFIGRKFNSRNEFENAMKSGQSKVKPKLEEILVDHWITTLSETSLFLRSDHIDQMFSFTDLFERSSTLYYLREYCLDHLDPNLRDETNAIYEEYLKIMANVEEYIGFLAKQEFFSRMIASPDRIQDLNLIDAEERHFLREQRQDQGAKLSDGIQNQLFEVLAKVEFKTQESDYNKPPCTKRKVKPSQGQEKSIMAPNEVLNSAEKLIKLSDTQVESIVELFFVKYIEPWGHDNLHFMVCSLCFNPYNEVRIIDALVTLMHNPILFKEKDLTSRRFPPIGLYNIDDPSKTYAVFCENVLMFLSDYFHDESPIFFSLMMPVINEASIESIREIKSQGKFHEKFKSSSSGADMVLSLLQLPVVYADIDKATNHIRFYEKITEIKPEYHESHLLEPPKLVSSKNFHALFGLVHAHWSQSYIIREEINRVLNAFIDKPANFPWLVPSMLEILDLSITETIPLIHERVNKVKVDVKSGIVEPDASHLEGLQGPHFLLIELILRFISSFFLKTLFNTTYRPHSSEKDPLEKNIMMNLEEALIMIVDDLTNSEIQTYMLDIYHLLELFHKFYKKNPPRSPPIVSLVSIGISYCLIFLVEERLEEEYEKEAPKTVEEFPEFGKVISRENDYSELPRAELIESFSNIKGKKEIDFDLVFSNFGLKYSQMISKLSKEPSGTIKEEIWHLNQKFPWIFEFSIKKDILKNIVKELSPEGEFRDRMVIDRKNAIHDFLKECAKSSKEGLFKFLSITFAGEAGIDDGGLRREFFTMIAEQLFNPDFGLFKVAANKISLEPSISARMIPYHLKLLEFSGIVLAKAIIDDINVGVTLTRYLLKHMLGRPISLADLEDIDPDLASGLRYIRDNDVEGLGLCFTFETKILDDLIVIDLIPNGSEVMVENSNKRDYVKKFCEAKMVKEIQPELHAFLKGFRALLPIGYLSHFSPAELELMIAGVSILNLDELKQNCIYVNCNKESQLARWFWEILGELTNEELSSFVFFISGSTKLPYGGKQTPLKLRKSGLPVTSLPLAHTCYFEFETPEYPSKGVFREKLLLAIYEGTEGFHVV